MTEQQEQQAKVFNPWNPTNKDMPQETMEKILRAYGWRGKLHTPTLFSQVCVHKSYVSRPEVWAEQAAATNEPMEIAPRPENCMDLKEADVHDNKIMYIIINVTIRNQYTISILPLYPCI